jgi:cation transport ATPase
MNTGNPDPQRETGSYEFVSFPIRGMSCQSCANRIEEALSGHKGVIKAVVTFVRREAGIYFHPKLVGPEALKIAVEDTGYRVPDNGSEPMDAEGMKSGSFTRLRPYIYGITAALGVIGFYLGLLTLTSDWYNARLEFGEYGVWIIALALGLGTQVMQFFQFRAWHGGSMKGAKCSLATSGGMSTTAMAACCSHYLTLVLPALGLPFLSSAAAGLASYQVYFFLAGVLSNLFGIGLMLRLMMRSGMIPKRALVKNLTFAGPGHVNQ